ncbi:MAG: DUF4190 domain-containing protein [Nocardioidaceae bacterium]
MSNQAPPPPPPPEGYGQGGYGQPSDPYGQPQGGYGQQPPSYGMPQYGGGAPVPSGTNSKAIWSLVLGILSFVCCGIITGAVAIFLGRAAQNEIARTGQAGAGMAKAGFILGIIGFVVSLIWIALAATGTLDFNYSVGSSS